MREVDGHSGINCELFVFAQLLALIIGQGLRDLPRQRSEFFRIGFPHQCRVFRFERDKNGIARRALHQGAERSALMLAQDEVALPVAGNGAVSYFRRSFFDLEPRHYFAACFFVVPTLPFSSVGARLP